MGRGNLEEVSMAGARIDRGDFREEVECALLQDDLVQTELGEKDDGT